MPCFTYLGFSEEEKAFKQQRAHRDSRPKTIVDTQKAAHIQEAQKAMQKREISEVRASAKKKVDSNDFLLTIGNLVFEKGKPLYVPERHPLLKKLMVLSTDDPNAPFGARLEIVADKAKIGKAEDAWKKKMAEAEGQAKKMLSEDDDDHIPQPENLG